VQVNKLSELNSEWLTLRPDLLHLHWFLTIMHALDIMRHTHTPCDGFSGIVVALGNHTNGEHGADRVTADPLQVGRQGAAGDHWPL